MNFMTVCPAWVQSLQGVDYVIKDKLLPEKVLDVEFFATPNMSTFYRGEREKDLASSPGHTQF